MAATSVFLATLPVGGYDLTAYADTKEKAARLVMAEYRRAVRESKGAIWGFIPKGADPEEYGLRVTELKQGKVEWL